MDTIEWTFDPLVRRNAYSNLMKLGAEIVGFEANFYGTMHDSINASDETDRAVVRWNLTSPGTREGRDGTVILQPDASGRPQRAAIDGEVLRAWIPKDAVALR